MYTRFRVQVHGLCRSMKVPNHACLGVSFGVLSIHLSLSQVLEGHAQTSFARIERGREDHSVCCCSHSARIQNSHYAIRLIRQVAVWTICNLCN